MKALKALNFYALMAMMILSLAACSSSGNNEATATGTPAATAEPTATPEATPEPTKEPEPAEISYLTWRGELPEISDGFQKKYPYYKVSTQSVAGVAEYIQAQKVRMLAGDLDVTSLRPESIEEYVKAGSLADLTGAAFLDNVNPSLFGKATFEGKVYAVPSSVNLVGVWYNKDLFAKFNLAIPTTWEEFLAVCEVLQQNSIVPMGNGGKDAWPMEFDIYPFMHKLLVDDPQIFDKINNGEMKYTDPVFIDAFKQIEAFYKTGYIYKDVLSVGYSEAANLFFQQKTGMIIQGEWLSPVVDEAQPAFEVGVFPMPIPGEGTRVVLPITVGVYEAVLDSTKHKEAAMAYLDYFSSKETGDVLAATAAISPIKGVEINPDSYLRLWEPYLQADSVDFFYNLQFAGANAEFTKGLQDLFLGRITPEKLAENIQIAQDKKAE